jgi:hypothetical protein
MSDRRISVPKPYQKSTNVTPATGRGNAGINKLKRKKTFKSVHKCNKDVQTYGIYQATTQQGKTSELKLDIKNRHVYIPTDGATCHFYAVIVIIRGQQYEQLCQSSVSYSSNELLLASSPWVFITSGRGRKTINKHPYYVH